jgi:hypothetical protein
MPRNTTRPTLALALSISMTAKALSVPVRVIEEAIDDGRLELRQIEQRKRIPVSSIEQFISTWPLTTRGTH